MENVYQESIHKYRLTPDIIKGGLAYGFQSWPENFNVQVIYLLPSNFKANKSQLSGDYFWFDIPRQLTVVSP